MNNMYSIIVMYLWVAIYTKCVYCLSFAYYDQVYIIDITSLKLLREYYYILKDLICQNYSLML